MGSGGNKITPVEETQVSLAIREALDAFAVVPIRNEIIRRALSAFGRPAIPETAELAEFVRGPLRDAVISLFDEQTADTMVKTLAAVVGRASSRGSGVVPKVEAETSASPSRAPRIRRMVICIGIDDDAYGLLSKHLQGIATVERSEDILALRERVARLPTAEVRIVIDARRTGARAGRVGSIARALTAGTRVLLWGASDAESRLCKVSHFDLDWLPLAAECTPSEVAMLCIPSNPSAPRPPAVEDLPILLVEHEAGPRRARAELIEAQGHVVLTAGTGAEALAICAQRAPRLVLVDQGLPGMGAAELAHLLRQTRGELAPPVVVLVSDILEATSLGDVAAAIPKELVEQKLQSLLEKLAPSD